MTPPPPIVARIAKLPEAWIQVAYMPLAVLYLVNLSEFNSAHMSYSVDIGAVAALLWGEGDWEAAWQSMSSASWIMRNGGGDLLFLGLAMVCSAAFLAMAFAGRHRKTDERSSFTTTDGTDILKRLAIAAIVLNALLAFAAISMLNCLIFPAMIAILISHLCFK